MFFSLFSCETHGPSYDVHLDFWGGSRSSLFVAFQPVPRRITCDVPPLASSRYAKRSIVMQCEEGQTLRSHHSKELVWKKKITTDDSPSIVIIQPGGLCKWARVKSMLISHRIWESTLRKYIQGMVISTGRYRYNHQRSCKVQLSAATSLSSCHTILFLSS